MIILLWVAVILLIAALIFAGIFIQRLIRKVEFYEQWITVLKFRINNAFETITAADIRGSFESDDEVGQVFKLLKANIDDLKTFTE